MSMSKIKSFLKKHKLLLKDVAIFIAIFIALFNTYCFIIQSDMLKFYFPTTIIGLILVWYGFYDRPKKEPKEKKNNVDKKKNK